MITQYAIEHGRIVESEAKPPAGQILVVAAPNSDERLAIQQQLGLDDYDLSNLVEADTGTSATPVELLEAMATACPNARVRVFYGSTEAGGVTCLEHADIARKPGSVGLPSPGMQIRADDSGELWCRGPALFDGYLGEADALVDGEPTTVESVPSLRSAT